ncbi:MAG: RNA polymerase sigma factor RpoD/SigA [Endomicrobium sp.]|jgi:RNA polymerase primary sigma factor|nr:RNA polymerase sigma factor RpoD/SigA [Endomicrobium sp.]MDR2644895.1 RNA polymerase sigma factor RpoD/SigA [Endomicrobium sp.]
MNARFDPLRLYFEAIRKIEPTSEKEIKSLWIKSKTDKAAFSRLVEQNYRLVIPIAKRFMKKGIDFMDLIEEGNLGLIKAVEKFDPARNIAFSTYAVYWIEQYIRRAVENSAKTIRIPSHIWDALNRWLKTKVILREKLKREPTTDEIAKKLKLNEDQVDDLMRASSVFNGGISLEAAMGEDSNLQVKDTISDDEDKSPESVTEIIRARADIGMALNDLPDREKEVVRMRFGIGGMEPMSLDSIGKVLNVSRERVRQLELHAFKKLKTILAKYNFIGKEEGENLKLDSRSGRDRRRNEIQPSKFKDKRSNIERRVKWI